MSCVNNQEFFIEKRLSLQIDFINYSRIFQPRSLDAWDVQIILAESTQPTQTCKIIKSEDLSKFDRSSSILQFDNQTESDLELKKHRNLRYKNLKKLI